MGDSDSNREKSPGNRILLRQLSNRVVVEGSGIANQQSSTSAHLAKGFQGTPSLVFVMSTVMRPDWEVLLQANNGHA